ncbi:membrane protein insertase YidC [Oleiharenicola lentus]|uniref:Membrane protein insertase YidC n=1 Tax=Oleiharenicola lentus TaxID=2508720 RepID=A0A4Q1C6R0_9BACT|nr:YidC/Oxa1 family insertase periplasmic-domain containing protein [Oleiharenicola lentus]RXK54476.1 membrane protein insertase YidC [Oleiharenicola lentus]
MDKKNTTIGVLLLVAAVVSMILSAKYAPKPPAPLPISPAPAETAATPAATGAPASASAAATGVATPATGSLSAPALGLAETVTLANDVIIVTLTNHGGAIENIALKQHLALQGQPGLYTLNAVRAAPALSLADFPGADRHTAYALVSKSETEAVYRATTPTLEITRRYSLAKEAGRDNYQIRHETTFRNLTDAAQVMPKAVFNLGTAVPLNAADYGMYLNTGYGDGEDTHFIARSDLEGGGFLSWIGVKDGRPPAFIERPSAVTWATVKNQFFCMILTPDQPGSGVRAERVKLDPNAPVDDHRLYGVTGYAQFELKPLAAGASSTFGANYYAGPKEYKRLGNADIFKHGEEKVMQFDSFFFNKIFLSGFFAPLLLTIMNWVHGLMAHVSPSWAWGWAIVITTLGLKIVFLPLTLAASKSAKRMAKLQPHMQALREKYKDNPQKMQAETLRIFRENKVNPVGGCIPILITIPFFVGFFAMLQSASDLRFAEFLWVADLSAPDTIARVFGLPVNIMPILMGATMIIQMKLTPMPSADPAQQTMFKIMPWIFTLFCYTFASGLALYSTINGLFTIGQQMIINRLPEPDLPINNPEGAKAGGMKNVTPKKKK